MSKFRLITGGIGTGKSLWTVDQLFQEKVKTPDRKIYTDITGIRHTGILSAPDDWRECEDNSLIIYDEVQYRELFSRHNSKRDKQILDLTTIRKRGIEIWMITQRARFLNPDVLGLVNEHVHLERNSNKSSKVYIWHEAQTNITKTTKLFPFEKYVYQYPEHLYGFYDSVKQDAKHHKRSYFRKEIMFIIIGLSLAMIPAYYVIKKWNQTPISASNGKDEKKLDSSTTHPDTDKPVVFKAPASMTKEEQDKVLQRLTLDKKIKDCMSSYGWTDGMCREALDPEYLKKNNDSASNISGSKPIGVIQYDASNPYQSKYEGEYQATAQPVFSGCVKYNGRYYGYTQQGTKLDVSANDCRKLIEQGDRPFNYFAQNNQQQGQFGEMSKPVESTKQTSQPKMTAEQYAKYLQYIDNTANNQVQDHLQARVVNGANSY